MVQRGFQSRSLLVSYASRTLIVSTLSSAHLVVEDEVRVGLIGMRCTISIKTTRRLEHPEQILRLLLGQSYIVGKLSLVLVVVPLPRISSSDIAENHRLT